MRFLLFASIILLRGAVTAASDVFATRRRKRNRGMRMSKRIRQCRRPTNCLTARNAEKTATRRCSRFSPPGIVEPCVNPANNKEGFRCVCAQIGQSAAPSSIPSGPPTMSSSQETSTSLPPSAAPSDLPTESPAPSQTPSDLPTESPVPSQTPSDLPTESPAPSQTPSDLPTESVAPSQTPSDLPTESLAPSAVPSAIPTESDSPSQTPVEEVDPRIEAPFAYDLHQMAFGYEETLPFPQYEVTNWALPAATGTYQGINSNNATFVFQVLEILETNDAIDENIMADLTTEEAAFLEDASVDLTSIIAEFDGGYQFQGLLFSFIRQDTMESNVLLYIIGDTALPSSRRLNDKPITTRRHRRRRRRLQMVPPAPAFCGDFIQRAKDSVNCGPGVRLRTQPGCTALAEAAFDAAYNAAIGEYNDDIATAQAIYDEALVAANNVKIATQAYSYGLAVVRCAVTVPWFLLPFCIAAAVYPIKIGIDQAFEVAKAAANAVLQAALENAFELLTASLNILCLTAEDDARSCFFCEVRDECQENDFTQDCPEVAEFGQCCGDGEECRCTNGELLGICNSDFLCEIPLVAAAAKDSEDPRTRAPSGSPTSSLQSSVPPTICSINEADTTSLVCGFVNTLFWFPPIQRDTNGGTLAQTQASSCCNSTFPEVQDLSMNYKFARYFPSSNPGPTGKMVGWDESGECATWVADLGPSFDTAFCTAGSFILAAYELNMFDPSDMELGYLGSAVLNAQVTKFSFWVPPGVAYQPILLAGFPDPTPINCSPLVTFYRNAEDSSSCVDVNFSLDI